MKKPVQTFSKWLFHVFVLAVIELLCVFNAFNDEMMQKSYLPVDAKVVTSSLHWEKYRDKQDGKTETSYTPRIEYTYAVAGTNYTNSKVYSGSYASGQSDLTAVIEAHPAGSACTAYYDPHAPANSFLLKSDLANDWLFVKIVGVLLFFQIFAPWNLKWRERTKVAEGDIVVGDTKGRA